jgi:hypothetical protein
VCPPARLTKTPARLNRRPRQRVEWEAERRERGLLSPAEVMAEGEGEGGTDHRGGAWRRQRVSRAFPSWKRSILAEIYLCHACSYHEIIEDMGTPGQALEQLGRALLAADPARTGGLAEGQLRRICAQHHVAAESVESALRSCG